MDNITGTAADEIFNAARSVGTNNGLLDTLSSSDSIDGGAGTDTLFVQAVTAATTTMPMSLKNVEKLTIENTGADAYTLDLTNADSSVKTLTVQNTVTANASVTVQNNKAALTNLNITNVNQNIVAASVAAAIAGTADSLAIAASSWTGGTLQVNGYETVSIASNGSVANTTGAITNTSLSTMNISGAMNLTTSLAAGTGNNVTIDASAATGNVSMTLGGIAGTVRFTGGSGNDVINMSGTYTAADYASFSSNQFSIVDF